MAVKGFATNNLVADHDMYIDFMDKRREYIIKTDKATDVLFCYHIGDSQYSQRDRIAIRKWHCMYLSYDIWQDLVKDYISNEERAAGYKKYVNVSVDILKKFRYRTEQTIKNAKCDVNNWINKKAGIYDACRYLAMYWTYLDLIKDKTTQRYFPDRDTVFRAVKVFGYFSGENPFIMNGEYYKQANTLNKKETKNMEEKKVTYSLDLDTPLKDIGLSVRSFNALWRAGYHTLGDIINLKYENLIKIRNLGLHSTKEILEKINELQTAEESVIDIAEQAAKEIEEEKGCGYPIENRMDALEANYRADFKKVCDTFKSGTDVINSRIDYLENIFKEHHKQIGNLDKAVHTVEKANVETNDDILTLVDKIIAKMEEKGVNDFSIGGKYSIEIHKESPIRNFSKVINYNGVRGE